MRWPGVTATAFDALARTGGSPAASIAGKVMRVAPPAIALATPPVSPAPNNKSPIVSSILFTANLKDAEWLRGGH
jgi:hypothetical protein